MDCDARCDMVDHHGSRLGRRQRDRLVLRDVDRDSAEHHTYDRRADRDYLARHRTRGTDESARYDSVSRLVP